MRMNQLYQEDEIIRGCQRKEQRSQKLLYMQHYRKMYGVCLRYCDQEDDAMDILQEGFIKVFEKIGDYQHKGSLEGWIRKIMINQAIQLYRERSRYFMVSLEKAHEVGVNENIFDHLSNEEILSQIQSLPAGYRTVFNLYAIEGYNHKEIAQMLGISPGTSKSQLSRARKILKGQIELLKKRCSA